MIIILIATLQDGRPVMLDASRSREALRVWRDAEQFHCPQCRERVILKIGALRIPHFAHRPDSECLSRFSEGESAAHLSGKHLLYELFSRLGMEPELEPLLPELAQRPDLLVRQDGRRTAIEFQCSRISRDLLDSRSTGYASADMTPVWLLQTPPKYCTRSEGVDVLSFSAFHQQFFSTGISPDASLLTLSPDTRHFHYFSHLLHLEGNRFVCVHRKLPVHLQTFPFVRPKLPDSDLISHYAACYRMHRTAFLQRAIFISRKGVQDPFLRNCYRLRCHPSAMPGVIGVPVRHSSAFAVHDCAWQLDLTAALKQWGLPLLQIPKSRLVRFVRRYPGEDAPQTAACIAYLQFLHRLDKTGGRQLTERQTEQEVIRLLSDRFLANQIEN